MSQLTDVVKNLLIINVLMFIGTMAIGDPGNNGMMELINNPDSSNFMQWGRYILAMFFPTSEYFRPFQIVTHMFMHGDLMHLLFNMFALFMFGPPLEQTLGHKRFFTFYFLTGFGALALHLAVQYYELSSGSVSMYEANIPMLGASGAVFGLLAGFGMLFPETRLQLLFPPIPIKAKYFVFGYAAIELFLGIGKIGGGIAHFAHVGGAIFGALLILYWRNTR